MSYIFQININVIFINNYRDNYLLFFSYILDYIKGKVYYEMEIS